MLGVVSRGEEDAAAEELCDTADVIPARLSRGNGAKLALPRRNIAGELAAEIGGTSNPSKMPKRSTS